MTAVALRVPSVEALFDAWSPEPLERRPLGDEARQRILVRRALAVRESRIGFLVFAVAVAISGLIDYGAEEGSLSTLVSQIFVVIAWVALWPPAFRLMTAASYRLGRHSFAQIAATEIEIRWA